VRFAAGQEPTIRGTLKTKSGLAIPYASVVIKNPENNVVAFQSSDDSGTFLLQLPKMLERSKLVLEVKHLGFKRFQRALQNGIDNYEVLLEEEAIPLAEVEVKSPPMISSRGDTLSYKVDAFAENEDRSIGDVINRLPGM